MLAKIMNKKTIIAIIAISLLVGTIALTVVVSSRTKDGIALNQKAENIRSEFSLGKLKGDYFGVLVLGSDEGATRTNGGDHTDSMTYIAINKKTNKALALPIYRDVLMAVSCADTAVNANQIYRDYGSKCLADSIEDMIDLPVDYQVYITSNGYVDILNAIGPIEVIPEATYESKFGNDDITYKFVEGQKQELTGNALLAYARFRGATSGESRANRHVQLLNGIFKNCTEKKAICGKKVIELMLTKDIESSIPFEELLEMKDLATIENLGVIAGTNFEDETGWHQRMNRADLEVKAQKIREEIFQ
ncbi:transcriptional regulator LytR [Erysipelotrichaceae bacterium]|nr:transcriptional regulator LytR [Erysipelotrichaceae bacterium]